MQKKLMKIICLVTAVLMVLTLAACGGSTAPAATGAATTAAADTKVDTATKAAAEPITLRLKTHYNNDNEKAPVDAAIAKLKNDYPNVTIQPEGYDSDSSSGGATMKARIASGDVPDIFEIDAAIAPLCIKANVIIPLDDLVQKSKITDILSPAVAGTLKYSDGKIWGLPVYGPMYHSMFYNKDLFDQNSIKVPTNFNELLDAVKALNAKNIIPITLSGKTSWVDGSLFDIFADRINPKGWTGLMDGSMKAADYKDAIDKLVALVKANAFIKGAATLDYDPSRAPFHAGKAAMLVVGEWEVSEGQKDLGEKLQYFPQFPVADAGKDYGNPGVMPGGAIFDAFAFSSKLKNPDYAFEVFCKYYQYYQEAQFTKEQVIWSTTKTDGMTPEKPLAALVTKYVADKGNLKPGGNLWLGQSPNQKFDTGFTEEMQKLLVGETADDFIKNIDKLQASTKQ